MKYLSRLLVVCLLIIAITACRKNKDKWMSETAVITGVDPRTCACCGGLMINFDNSPDKYAKNLSLIDEMPADAGIDFNSTFPIYVKVNWKVDGNCGTEIIDITKIERR
jgi:hypothetical protein